MPFFGQSFGDFKGQIGGLLSDPDKAFELASNPWVGIGTGLLSGKGAAGAMAGLAAAKKQGQSDEDRERLAKLREQLAALIQQQAGGAGVPGQPPPTPTEQSMQMSLNPGQPGSSLMPGGGPMIPGQTPPIMPGGLPGGGMSETDRLLQQLGWQGLIQR